MVDLGKALASQFIVWHHLALYGPMSDVVGHLTGDLMEWLVSHARLAVQVFLVMGGFLAARGLLPTPDAPTPAGPGVLLQTQWRRLKRLMPPYFVALLAAVWCALCARTLIDHPTIPEAPTLWQFVTNVLMLQDATNALGYSTKTLDGAFGKNTYDALRAAQRSFSLTADGVCGCNTWKKLTSAVVGIGRTKTVID